MGFTMTSRMEPRRRRPAWPWLGARGVAWLISGLVVIAIAVASPATAAAGASTSSGYAVTILSTLCTEFGSTSCPTYPLSSGAGINDRGWIAGDSNYPGIWTDPTNGFQAPLTEHATLWRNGQISDLGTLGGPNSSLGPVARLNDTGLISGQAQTATIDPFNEQWAINLGCTPTDAPCDGTQYELEAFVWKARGPLNGGGPLNGVMRALPTLGGNNSAGFGVANDHGQLAGVAEDAYQDPSCVSNSPAGGPTQVLDWEPVVWGPGYREVRQLPLFQGDTVGLANAINDAGQVVGGSGFCGPIAYANLEHALLWENGRTIDLGSLGGAYDNLATAINDRGQVVGWSDLPGDKFKDGNFIGMTTHSFLWQHGVMTDLGTLPGLTSEGLPYVSTYAYGVNNAGQVVGSHATRTTPATPSSGRTER